MFRRLRCKDIEEEGQDYSAGVVSTEIKDRRSKIVFIDVSGLHVFHIMVLDPTSN